MAQKHSTDVLKRIFQFLKPVGGAASITLGLLTIGIALELLSVYFLSPAITNVSQSLPLGTHMRFSNWFHSDTESAVRLKHTLMWMALAQLCFGIMTYVRSFWDARFSMLLLTHMRSIVYDRLQNMAFTVYDQMTSGKLVSRALGDLQAVHSFVNGSVYSVIDIALSVTAYLILLGVRSKWLMLGAILPMPLWCCVVFRFNRKAEPYYRAQQKEYDRLTSALTECLSAIPVVKSFGREQNEIQKFRHLNQTFRERLLGAIFLQARLNPTLQGIATGIHISLFTVSAWLIQQRQLQIGDLMIVGAATRTILSKLQQIQQTTEAWQRAMVCGRRLFEVLDMPQISDQPRLSTASYSYGNGQVEFRNVTFGYANGPPLLKNVSITIPGESVTALIGPTAAGKTTLSALIARFYDPQEGEILIDNEDIRHMNPVHLRRLVGFVFQETFLFTDTIGNNIRYGRRDVSDEMLRAAAHAAHADDFIERLPQAYDTPLGEYGIQLSGGQRQRLALARALVYDPKILVLDDATAALDASTESVVRQRMTSVFKGRTVLLITTRMTNLQLADQIIKIEGGHTIPC